MAGNVNLGTLYDINKKAMAQFEPLDPIKYSQAIKYIVLSMKNNDYFMLLCRERNDYTIFNRNKTTLHAEYGVQEIQETLNNRGQVIAIDNIEGTSNYEIWIRDIATEENFLYMLFPCNDFIVEV